MITACRWIVAVLATITVPTKGVFAHDIDLNVQVVSPTVMQGVLSFSDDSEAEGQYIRVENLTDETFSSIALQTNDKGGFRVTGVPGHRYRITAEGNEGHTVSLEVLMQVVAEPENSGKWPPLYLMIAAILLLSLIPARYLKKR